MDSLGFCCSEEYNSVILCMFAWSIVQWTGWPEGALMFASDDGLGHSHTVWFLCCRLWLRCCCVSRPFPTECGEAASDNVIMPRHMPLSSKNYGVLTIDVFFLVEFEYFLEVPFSIIHCNGNSNRHNNEHDYYKNYVKTSDIRWVMYLPISRLWNPFKYSLRWNQCNGVTEKNPKMNLFFTTKYFTSRIQRYHLKHPNPLFCTSNRITSHLIWSLLAKSICHRLPSRTCLHVHHAIS